jgi:hypothetical protein
MERFDHRNNVRHLEILRVYVFMISYWKLQYRSSILFIQIFGVLFVINAIAIIFYM